MPQSCHVVSVVLVLTEQLIILGLALELSKDAITVVILVPEFNNLKIKF